MGAGLEVGAKPPQRGRIVELVPVDSEHPGVRPGKRLEDAVRGARVLGAHDVDVVELVRELMEDPRRFVLRVVVDGVDLVAERRHVPDRPLHEDVLVTDENRADDPDAHA